MTSDTDDILFGHATLLDEIDQKVMVLLRDGRTLIGVLRSVDQFANLVLHKTIERIHVGREYGDIYRGIFVVRGENVVIVGLIDTGREERLGLQQVSVEEILEAQRRQQEQLTARLEQRRKAGVTGIRIGGPSSNDHLFDDFY